MRGPARRVRRVRLAAPRRELVRRGAVLLEDALRTASLSGGALGRLLLVRRLDVGAIRAHAAPSALALAIEQRFRAAEVFAVHGDDPAAPAAGAVWFRDAFEAHAALALRLASGGAPAGWFWRLAVPAWSAELGRDQGLRAVLSSAADVGPGGARALVEVVDRVMEAGAAGPLLDALRWQDGPALLRACGWTPPSAPLRVLRLESADREAAPSVPDLPEPWRALVIRQARRWGEDDPRTLWLSAVALAADVPARLLDARLPERARHALARALAPPAEPSPSPEIAAEAPPAPDVGIAIREAAEEAEISPVAADPVLPEAMPSPVVRLSRKEETAVDPAPHLTDPDVVPHAEAATTSVDAGQTVRPAEAARIATDPDRAQSSAIQSDHPTTVAAVDAPTPVQRAPATTGDFAVATEAAGLPFLVPVLARLGMAGFLERHPELIEADFPAHLLRHVALRAGVPADDPMLAVFAPRAAASIPGRIDFVAPDIWRQGIARAGRPRLVPASPDHPSILCDAGGLLPLAAWHGDAPAGVAAMLEDSGDVLPSSRGRGISEGATRQSACHPEAGQAETKEARIPAGRRIYGLLRTGAEGPVHSPAIDPSVAASIGVATASALGSLRMTGPLVPRSGNTLSGSGRDLLLAAWTFAARRWCRRFAGLGLYAVVRRPGRVLATRTHVDVVFDHHHADIRVRRAGMDLDPGWVPWLGRVVQIHYLHGEAPRAR